MFSERDKRDAWAGRKWLERSTIAHRTDRDGRKARMSEKIKK